jgi:chemotaxis protein MotB
MEPGRRTEPVFIEGQPRHSIILRLTVLLLALVLTGCVSSTRYEEALSESDARKAELDKTAAQLDEARTANQKLTGDLSALKAARDKDAADCESEKKRLTDLSKSCSDDLSAARAELDARQKEKDYLDREVQRLQAKSGEISSEKEKELANVKSTYEKLVGELKGEIEKGDIKITRALDRLSVNMVEKILFDSGRAEIKPGGVKVLKRVAEILKSVTDKEIRVEGHTDNVPIGEGLKRKFPSNWELSTARATNVVKYFAETGVNAKLLSAAGYADNKPVASNDTPEGKAQNRRIEIVLLPLNVDRVLEELKKEEKKK